ncbi:MAG: hypothetical protein JWN14_56 [Chthonomonadales bacterium]|nr:hypothetical protein [Chthonomonadales bacterium]
MTASPNSAKCVQCNAPVVGNDLLCQYCLAQKSLGKPGSASPPKVSQPGQVPTPLHSPVTSPSKKPVLSRVVLASAPFILVCIVGSAYYFLGLKKQNDAGRHEGALLRSRQQKTGGPTLARKARTQQSGPSQRIDATFVCVDAAAASTDKMEFKVLGSYLQTIQTGPGFRFTRGSYKINGEQITLQEDTGNKFFGSIHGDIITMNWGARSIEYARVGALPAGQRTTPPSSDDRQQPDPANQTRGTSSQQQSSSPSTPSSSYPSNEADAYIREAGYDALQAFSGLRREYDRLTRETAARGVNRMQRAGAQMNIASYMRQLDRDGATIRQNIPYASADGKLHGRSYLETIQKAVATLSQYKRDGTLAPTSGSTTGTGITDTSIFGGIHFLSSGRGQAVRNRRDGDTTAGQDQ